MNKFMFKTTCAHCGKEVVTFGKSKTGELGTVYCGKICETNAKYDKRFDTRYTK